MSEYEERAQRRKEKAEYISNKTKEHLSHLLLEFHALIEESRVRATKIKKRTSKKEVSEEVKQILDAEKEAFKDLIDKYEKRVVSFIREQITSDDGKYL